MFFVTLVNCQFAVFVRCGGVRAVGGHEPAGAHEDHEAHEAFVFVMTFVNRQSTVFVRFTATNTSRVTACAPVSLAIDAVCCVPREEANTSCEETDVRCCCGWRPP